jgi:hypothetical protein
MVTDQVSRFFKRDTLCVEDEVVLSWAAGIDAEVCSDELFTFFVDTSQIIADFLDGKPSPLCIDPEAVLFWGDNTNPQTDMLRENQVGAPAKEDCLPLAGYAGHGLDEIFEIVIPVIITVKNGVKEILHPATVSLVQRVIETFTGVVITGHDLNDLVVDYRPADLLAQKMCNVIPPRAKSSGDGDEFMMIDGSLPRITSPGPLLDFPFLDLSVHKLLNGKRTAMGGIHL